MEEGSFADNSGREDLGVVEEEMEDKSSGRKMKSLAMLCNKYVNCDDSARETRI